MTLTDDTLRGCVPLATELRAQVRHLLYVLRNLGGTLTSGQVSTLNALAERPRRMGEVAALGGVRLPTATEQVARLERDGLVRREHDPGDLRCVVVTLTEEGRRVLTEANDGRDAQLAERLARLTAAERRKLAAALPVIAKLTDL